MGEVFRPKNSDEVSSAVKDALNMKASLELFGQGTRRSLGRPVKADASLDMSALTGVQMYEPEELVMVVAPGTPMREISQVLIEHNQQLAFEPPDYGPLWGLPADEGTVGGMIMTGRNGPRRLSAGGVRDYVLGVKGVNGFGELFVSGGRVVKNVTGFDLPKILTGSFGTLCAATEITLKLLPLPPEAATLVVSGLKDGQAVAAMTRVLTETSIPVSSAAHLPAEIAKLSRVDSISARQNSATLLRVEGFGPSVESGIQGLKKVFGSLSDMFVLDKAETQQFWKEVTNASFFIQTEKPIWKLSVPPSEAAAIISKLGKGLTTQYFYDWAGGAIWIEAPASEDAGEAAIRGTLDSVVVGDGHATLIRASEEVRANIAPFHPLSPVLAAVEDRLRKQFDPQGMFNPGRMYGVRNAN